MGGQGDREIGSEEGVVDTSRGGDGGRSVSVSQRKTLEMEQRVSLSLVRLSGNIFAGNFPVSILGDLRVELTSAIWYLHAFGQLTLTLQ